MPKKRPRKPTTPYGYIEFPQDGPVEKRMFSLSTHKKKQEKEVVEAFVGNLVNIRKDISVLNIVDLNEADHDFLVRTKTADITVQLTEIPLRDYAIEISAEEYNSGKYRSFYQKEAGGIPLGVDDSRRDSAIQRSIANKLSKNYVKGKTETLWLLIFSTTAYLKTKFWENGAARESVALQNARQFLANSVKNPFDEIWFFNLLTSPTRIWPG